MEPYSESDGPKVEQTGVTPPVVELRDVSRVFGSAENPTLALRSVSLTVQRGEFVAIVGPSGAGKSTLLNILGLLDRPSSGRHLLGGVDVRTLSERERNRLRAEQIGFVFQDSHMLLDDSAAENAALGLKVQGAALDERRSRVADALSRLGMLRRSQARARDLSGGERQRVAIARAIATRPALLLADEPTGALDTANSDRVIGHLRELNRQGVTVVVITHDPTVASASSRQVSLLDGNLHDETISLRHPPHNNLSASAVTSPANQLADVQPQTGNPPLTLPGVPAPPTRKPRRYLGQGKRVFLRRLWDDTLDAISSQTSRPGRAVLLLAAFLLGTGGLVCSLGISQSAAAQVSQRLTTASLDEVIVRAADAATSAGFYDRRATDSAIVPIQALPGVIDVGYVAAVSATAAHVTLLPPGSIDPQPVFDGSIHVADPNYLDIQNVIVTPVGAIALLDNAWGGAVAIVGESAAERLGIPAVGPGRIIHVGAARVDVVGIITDIGRDPTLSDAIILSRSAAGDITLDDPQLVVRTRPGFPAPVAEAIPLAVSPEDPSKTRVETVADLRTLTRGITTDLGTLVGLISWLLLALASLSAATAMYLSVQARVREIALRRAIGASRTSIWRMFTLEGLMLGAAGGVAGSAFGLLGVLIVCLMQGWTPTLDLIMVAVGILAGAGTGVLSAAYPALVAARADPAQVIRR